MSDLLENEAIPEPERYELHAGPLYEFGMSRRDLLKRLGGGMLIFMALDAEAQENRQKETREESRQSGESGRPGRQNDPAQEIGAWLHIGEDGKVTVYTGKVEVGQDIRTSLSQAVAEELRVPLASIRMVMGDTDLTPYDRGTFGSRTTPDMNPRLRRAAASAREILLGLAAERWEADAAKLKASEGKIVHPDGRTLTYGNLTKGKELVQTIDDPPALIPATDWTVAGKSIPKRDGREVVTGRRPFTSDMKLPGMVHGKVIRAEKLNSTLVSVDRSAAEKIPGVTVVREGDFLGVVAPDRETVFRAAGAVKAEWKAEPQVAGRSLYEHLRKTAEAPGEDSSLRDALSKSDRILTQSYTAAYIAHAPLETRAALAEWKDGRLTVWTGTQRPFGVREQLAEAFNIPQERIRVIMPDTGSGYGGKHTGEAALEAARLAKAVGKPVKVLWSREEEFTNAYFRPAGVIDVRSGGSKSGKLTAWDYHNYNAGGAGLRSPYEVGERREEFHGSDTPLRQGSYRALASTANHFARETHMDEVAHALKVDPLEFRLRNLENERLRAVFEAAAKGFGWGKSKPPQHHGYGIAGGIEKGGFVATCAEVAVDPKSRQVKVERAVTAFECGAIVNPDGLKNQVDGSIIMGLGGALFEAVEFDDGKILNPRFSAYRVPRFSDIPRLQTILLDRKDLPSAGAGECPIVGIAPAIGNAIFQATGIRLRSLPLAPQGLNEEPE